MANSRRITRFDSSMHTHVAARINEALTQRSKRELYADLAAAVRNTAAPATPSCPDPEGNHRAMQSTFTKKAKGVERPGGKVQLNVQFPKSVFEKIAADAFAANRSFSAQVLHFVERGMQEREEAHGT